MKNRARYDFGPDTSPEQMDTLHSEPRPAGPRAKLGLV